MHPDDHPPRALLESVDDASGHRQVLALATSLWVSRAVYAAARLGLADLLANGPARADELAEATRSHAGSLFRLMRALAGLGLLEQHADGRFELTPVGAALRSDAAQPTRDTVLALSGRRMWETWGDVMYSLQTGRTAFEKVYGKPLFEHMAAHPDEARYFASAMVGLHGDEPPAVAQAYDFAGVGSMVDVGGSSGNMLAAIASRHGALRGIVYDLPHVQDVALGNFRRHGLDGRCGFVGGSFFESVPSGHDLYLLSHVIHDWDEDQCVAILQRCHAAMAGRGRLLLVELVLPEGSAPHPGKVLDLLMLTVAGGIERTGAEYGALLGRAGFRVTRIVPTASAVSIVEAVPV